MKQYQQVLKHKVEILDSSPGLENADHDRKELERLKGEMVKLDRIFEAIRVPNRKKPEYHKASEVQELYYDVSKQEYAEQFVKKVQKDWEEYEKMKSERVIQYKLEPI